MSGVDLAGVAVGSYFGLDLLIDVLAVANPSQWKDISAALLARWSVACTQR